MRSGRRTSIPEFGIRQAGIDYIDRPSVYALIENNRGQIAVIKTCRGYFLPGGGVEADESDIDALKREILEEMGGEVTIIAKMGETIEYLKANSDRKHYRMHSQFYRAQLLSKSEERMADHCLVWQPWENAGRLLVSYAQGWMVQNMIKAKECSKNAE